MRHLLLTLLVASSCAEAGPRRRPAPKPAARPSPIGAWSSGAAGTVLASRVYPSSGRVELCVLYTYDGAAPLAVRLELGAARVDVRLPPRSHSNLCRRVGTAADHREGLEARLVLAGALSARLTAELSAWDANP